MSAWLATTGKRMCGNAVLLAIVGFPCFKRGKTELYISQIFKWHGMCSRLCLHLQVFLSANPGVSQLETAAHKLAGTHFSHPDFFRDPPQNLIFQGPTFPKCSHPEFNFSGTYFFKVFPPRIFLHLQIFQLPEAPRSRSLLYLFTLCWI